MAISFRSQSRVTGTGTSVTGTEPTGTVTGDVMVACYAIDDSAGGNNIVLPDGWVPIESGLSATGQFMYALCYIVRGASAPSLTFTQSASTYRDLTILTFSGVDSAWTIDSFTSGISTNAASNNPASPTVTVLTANTMAVAFGVNWSGSGVGGYGAPSGYTIQTSNASGERTVVATKSLTKTGTETPGAFTNASSTTADSWGATLVLAQSGVIRPTVAPYLRGEYESYWYLASASQAASVTVDSLTDVLVVCAATSYSGRTVSTPTGGTGISWSLQQSITAASYGPSYVWTATNITPQTFTLNVGTTGVSGSWGFSVIKFANASVGASSSANANTGFPTVGLTTTGTGSTILVLNNDYSGNNGVSRAWLTGAGPITEKTYSYKSGSDTYYIGLHTNVPVGTYSLGLSAPAFQTYSLIALELTGNPGPITAWFTA